MTGLSILHVNTERTWRGGERQMLLLAAAQRSHGHRPLIACQPGSPCAMRAHELRLSTLELRMRGEWDLLAARELRRTLQRHRIDLVHAHTSHAQMLVLLATSQDPRPVIVHRRVDFPVRLTGLNRWKYGCRIDRFIAISGAVRAVLVAGGMEPERISVVHSAVPPIPGLSPHDHLELIRQLGLATTDRVLLTVASLVDHKGHRYLLDAMPRVIKAFSGVRLLLAGEGPLRERLEQQASALRLGAHVRFLGFRCDVHALLQVADALVVPSHLEGLNTSILDAMSLGTPVVASAAGGIPEAIGGEGGWLVSPRAPDELAAAVIHALSDRAEASRRAEAGRRRVHLHFSVDRMHREVEAVYLEVLARRDMRQCSA